MANKFTIKNFYPKKSALKSASPLKHPHPEHPHKKDPFTEEVVDKPSSTAQPHGKK